MKVIPLYKNETELIKRAMRSDREAQHLLFETHAPKMLSVCRYYIRDIQQAEEAMLNGFLKVFTNIKSFKGTGSFEGWMRRIVVREAISYLRNKQTVEFNTEEIETYQTEYVENVDLEVQDIQRLIDDLPEGYKIVFVMHVIEGFKHHEIAGMLKISESTSKSQLFKARRRLQEQIKQLNKIRNGTT
ncbi:MAG: RNA polymerase sigma factor [Flavobacteriaceae bacterium]|nr:RNA polymerase sigma factor [Bacteroidia bacterium]MBT8288508.1 RNA polymerase sigma factor [Bacteroidia bacterium]NNF75649.1 RNA polymerase sigma factor [Flavobacteriaceae bacterium]NNK71637.1 RNA polymerase sigma factor [Flavobacteriaceae bacterium]